MPEHLLNQDDGPLPYLSGYVFSRRLGGGASATVYAARHIRTGNRVAIKIGHSSEVEPELIAAFQILSAFEDRALQLAVALDRLDDGRLCLITERASGEPLPLVRLDERGSYQVALELSRVLAVLHARGQRHGDISPDNVLVAQTPEGPLVKLIDLGSSEAGSVAGTPGYLAPEVLRGEGKTLASDRYSLACLLVELLSGRALFGDLPLDRRAHAHLNLEPNLPRELPPAVAMALTPLLAKLPDDRPRSLLALILALGEAAGRPLDLVRRQFAESLLAGMPLNPPGDLVAQISERIAQGLEGRGALLAIRGGAGQGLSTLARYVGAEAAVQGFSVMRLPPAVASLEALAEELSMEADEPTELSVAGRLAELSAVRPVCVVVDAPGRPELLRLARALEPATRTAPVLAILMMGPSDPVTSQAQTLALVPLTPDERRNVIRSRIVGEAVVEALGGLFDRAQVSSPGALLHALRALAARDILHRADGAWVLDSLRLAQEGPGLVSDAIHQEEKLLAGLEADSQLLVAALAVLGRPVRRAALVHVTGRDSLSVAVALERLMHIGIIDRDGEGLYRLAGARLERLGLALSEPETLKKLHRAAATLVDDDAALDYRALRAWHRAFAGDRLALGELSAAVSTFMAAGEAMRALRLAQHVAEVGGENTATILAKARALSAVGELIEARHLLSNWVERSDDEDEEVVLELAFVLSKSGDFAEARRLLAPRAHSEATRLELARALYMTGERSEADLLASKLESAISVKVRVAALHLQATVAWEGGDTAQAIELARGGLELLGSREPALRADLLRTQGAAHFYAGDSATAREYLLAAVEIDRALGRAAELAKSLNTLGIAQFGLGDWEAARRSFGEYRLLCGRTGNAIELAKASNNLAFLVLRMGDIPLAIRLFKHARGEAESAGYERMVAIATANLGEALRESGACAQAKEAFDLAAPTLKMIGANQEYVELLRYRVELALDCDELAIAREAFDVLDSTLVGQHLPVENAHAQRVLARLEHKEGHLDLAEALARAARSSFEGMKDPYEEARCVALLAELLLARRQHDDALVQAEVALATFRELGARLAAARVDELCREILSDVRRSGQAAIRGEVLLELARGFGATLDLTELLPLVLSRVVGLLAADHGAFALLRPDGSVEQAVVHNFAWHPGEPLPVSQGLISEVFQTGKPVLVQDVLDDSAYGTRRSVCVLGLRSLLGVPVIGRSTVLGVLYVDSRKAINAELEGEKDLLMAIAGMIGISVENARLFEAQRHRSTEICRLIAAITQRVPTDPIIMGLIEELKHELGEFGTCPQR